MGHAHRPTSELASHLSALYASFPFSRSLAQDPLSSVRRLARDRRSAEISGLFASTLAIGNTTAIRGSIASWLDLADGDLPTLVDRSRRPLRRRELLRFRHRWIRGDQMAYLAHRIHRVEQDHGGVEELFLEGLEGPHGFAGGIDAVATGLRGDRTDSAPPGYQALFPTPLDAGRSACKRLTLFVRWMARRGFPDLGVWSRVSPSELRIPLDQHVYWIAFNLGLTQRRSRTWATVEEVTEALRKVDPADPIKFDFVLCHTGISGDCPKRADWSVCGLCSVRPDCRMWRHRRTPPELPTRPPVPDGSVPEDGFGELGVPWTGGAGTSVAPVGRRGNGSAPLPRS